MPLVKRAIEPVFICRSQLNDKVKNELEGVVINSLAGLIKQLSSLSKHAENLFGELFNEASNIFTRSATLNERVGDLHKRLKQMDATVKEEIKVEDIISMSHFKSTHMEDQQILSRQTLPTAVYESYTSCDQPPALNEFTRYRDDEKEGLKFYTDPNYFYRLWVEEQTQLLEKKKKREKKKRRRNRDNQPKKEIRVAQKKKYIGADVEFRDVVAENASTAQLVRVSRDSNADFQSGFEDSMGQQSDPSPENIRRANSSAGNKPMHAPPPPPVSSYDNIGQESPKPITKPIAPPPPPPVAPQYQPQPPQPPLIDPQMNYGGGIGIPAPVAPPTVPQTVAPPAPPPPPMINIPAPPPPPPDASHVAPKPISDPRNDLLSAIRLGKQLRKVEEQKTEVEKKQESHGNDVASILARRVAFELSDSETGSDDSDTDSEWDD